MKHTHISAPISGRIEHVTGDEWRTAVGPYNNTRITLRRDDESGKTFEFVVTDHVDLRCKFWLFGDLHTLKKFTGAIDELIKQAEKNL